MQDLKGAAAFITGGASGIGLSIARALAAEGVKVTIADIDQAQIDKVLPEIPGAFGVKLDVRDRAAWQAAKAAAEAVNGPTDIVVNNAGIGPCQNSFADMRAEDFDRLIGINLTGVFNGINAFAADLRARGRGHVVNTSSMAGLMTYARLGAYTAAKFAVVGMSEVLRKEMAPHGVGVSVLCPGLIETRLGETSQAMGNPPRDPDSPVRSASAKGLDATFVGERVAAAIKADELYILTHGEYGPIVGERGAAIVAAFAATPPSSEVQTI